MRGFDPSRSAAFDQDAACDLDSLLHPAQAFDSPADVVNDADLSLNEKRAILASWASDACAVEAVPSLRRPPGSERLVSFDEVMDALRAGTGTRTRMVYCGWAVSISASLRFKPAW
jgi:hypothetical protein